MKFEDINKVYTTKVAEWLGKGYWINAGTMSGSQGEHAHVDLTNGTEIIRVLMEDRTEWEKYDTYDCTVVVVGRVPATERVRIGASDRLGNTIWNNKLEELDKVVFYRIGLRNSEWYGTKAEATAQRVKWTERHSNRPSGYWMSKEFKGVEQLVLPFVRREVIGCKTAKASDITKVEKIYHTDWNGKIKGVTYQVTVKGKTVKLA